MPAFTGTSAVHVPSVVNVAATPLTVTLATAVSSVAVPVTVTVWTSPANVPRAGLVMWMRGAFGSIAGAFGS